MKAPAGGEAPAIIGPKSVGTCELRPFVLGNYLFSKPSRDVKVRMAAPGLGNRKRVVMVVEDDDKVFTLIRSALSDLGSGLEVQRVKSGQDALHFLRNVDPYKAAERPRLVIIDTASFVRNASPSLDEMQRQVQLQSVPVLVLGTEPASHHGLNASPLGGQFYIVKSLDPDVFRKQLKEVCLFSLWVSALQETPDRNATGFAESPDVSWTGKQIGPN